MTEPLVQSIGQIHVTVDDLPRAVAFYRDVLGLPLLFEVPAQSMAFFDCGGVRLYLGKAESPDFDSRPLLCLRVADIETAHGKLVERSVETLSPPHAVHRTETTELWLSFFKDSEGTALALMEERGLGEPATL